MVKLHGGTSHDFSETLPKTMNHHLCSFMACHGLPVADHGRPRKGDPRFCYYLLFAPSNWKFLNSMLIARLTRNIHHSMSRIAIVALRARQPKHAGRGTKSAMVTQHQTTSDNRCFFPRTGPRALVFGRRLSLELGSLSSHAQRRCCFPAYNPRTLWNDSMRLPLTGR